MTRVPPDAAGPYRLQAAIAACHARAATWQATDWPAIAALYGRLHALTPSPVIALNRVVAVSYGKGPSAALPLLHALEGPALAGYPPFPAVRGTACGASAAGPSRRRLPPGARPHEEPPRARIPRAPPRGARLAVFLTRGGMRAYIQEEALVEPAHRRPPAGEPDPSVAALLAQTLGDAALWAAFASSPGATRTGATRWPRGHSPSTGARRPSSARAPASGSPSRSTTR